MVGYKTSLGPIKKELKTIGACAIAEAGFYQGHTLRWGIAWTFKPDIKLNNFLPNKQFRKAKLRPPMSFPIPESYDSTSALAKLTELITNLKVILLSLFYFIYEYCLIMFICIQLVVSTLNSKSNKEKFLYQADIKGYENTWAHYRRKRRMEQISSNRKRQKTDDTLNIAKSDNEMDEPRSEMATNSKPLFVATLVLRKTNNTIWIDMLHLDGNKDNLCQVLQYFKNRFV